MQTELRKRTGSNKGGRLKKLLKEIYRKKFIYFLMLPGFIYLIIFEYYPLYFLQVAFRKFNIFKGLSGSPWVGFKNFTDLFSTKYFLQSIRNTVIINGMQLLFGFPVQIILAILLNELKNKYFKRTVQTIIYLPHFLSWVIVGGLWITILSPQGGIVNEFIKLFGGEPIFFMARKDLFRWVLVFTEIWKSAGWGTILYLAAIVGIETELYEASIIDGANRFQQMIYITVPGIMPVIIVKFILNIGNILDLFQQVFVMYNPVVSEVSETIGTYVYQIGLQKGNVSFGTAAGLFQNAVGLILMLITNKLAKKLKGYSLT